MVQVEVNFGSWLPRVFGHRKGPVMLNQVLAQGATFGHLLRQLIKEYPALAGIMVDPASQRLYDHVVVMINGRFLDLAGGPETHLRDGDKVQILPFLAGG